MRAKALTANITHLEQVVVQRRAAHDKAGVASAQQALTAAQTLRAAMSFFRSALSDAGVTFIGGADASEIADAPSAPTPITAAKSAASKKASKSAKADASERPASDTRDALVESGLPLPPTARKARKASVETPVETPVEA